MLAGRVDEFAQLDRLLRELVLADGNAVQIEGEPDIGKNASSAPGSQPPLVRFSGSATR